MITLSQVINEALVVEEDKDYFSARLYVGTATMWGYGKTPKEAIEDVYDMANCYLNPKRK